MHRESQLRELGKVFADLSTDYLLRGTDKLHIQDQKGSKNRRTSAETILTPQTVSITVEGFSGWNYFWPVIVSAVTFDVYR